MSACKHGFSDGVCGMCKPQPTYTDDVIAVMRATIDQLRRDVAQQNARIDELATIRAKLEARLDGSPLPEHVSCQHEWTESIRCSRCGQTIESRVAVGLELDAALALLQRWKNRRNGNRKFQLWSDTTGFLKRHKEADQ